MGKDLTEARSPQRKLIPDMSGRTRMSQLDSRGTANRWRTGNGFSLRGSECNRGTGCGNTARPGLCGGRRVTDVPTAEIASRTEAERAIEAQAVAEPKKGAYLLPCL